MTEVAPVTHRPLGSGHPYRIDPDQRHPVHPVAGEPLELRVLVSVGVAAVTVELAHGGETITLAPVDLDGLYPTATDANGHLAVASGARPDVGELSIWRAVLPATPNEPFRYRFAGAPTSSPVRPSGSRCCPGVGHRRAASWPPTATSIGSSLNRSSG